MIDTNDGYDCEHPPIPGHLDDLEWLDRVVFASDGGGRPFVYEPGELIVTQATLAAFADLIGPFGEALPLFDDLVLLTGVADVTGAARAIRTRGGTAQPNHVVFADSRGSTVYGAGVTFGNPATSASGVTFGNPFTGANGVTFGNPFTGANGVTFGNPAGAGAGGGCCDDCHGTYQAPVAPSDVARRTVALAARPLPETTVASSVGTGMKVLIIDTGLAQDNYRPAFVGDVEPRDRDDVDEPNTDGDGYVDTTAGHGTFIAGIIERMAPAASVRVERMLTTFGVGDDAAIGQLIDSIPIGALPNIFNLSFSSYTEDDQPPLVITRAIQRLVAKGHRRRQNDKDKDFQGPIVVASAGNSGQCRKAWPAALPEVISVGALASMGPAPFTNFGPWVQACAPGVDIVSCFFRRHAEIPNPPDPIPLDNQRRAFQGWASWSGTSFSAPIVIGALLQRQALGGSLEDAVRAVIHEPRLTRMPGLGTIVNAHP